MTLSVIVPVLDEVGVIATLVSRLLPECDEVVVVDGGSVDGTAAAAAAAGARVVTGARGRGAQMDAGARASTGDVLWFVHADTTLPPGAPLAVRHAAALAPWGCFAVRVESSDPRLRWCGRYMTARARRYGSVTGDMAIWARRDVFIASGGFGPGNICEDLSLTDRLRRQDPPRVIALRVGTSARRWEQEGVARTMLRMWAVRGGYRLGLPAGWLVPLYRGRPRD